MIKNNYKNLQIKQFSNYKINLKEELQKEINYKDKYYNLNRILIVKKLI